MLGKYRHVDFLSNGAREHDSSIATKGGLNEQRLGSENTGYSRLDDPFIPFITVDIDFESSPFFGDMKRLINVQPRDYAAYLDSLLVSRYKASIDGSDENEGVSLKPCEYNIDMNYMMPSVSGGDISAAEWLYMKLCGVPSIDSYRETSDLNAPPLEATPDKYESDIERINNEIKNAMEDLVKATSDYWEAEHIRQKIKDLEEERTVLLKAQDTALQNAITVTPSTNPSSTSQSSNEIDDPRVTDFIRSCKMFYELIQNHAYMITSVDLGDILTTYYVDENNTLASKFNLKLGETVDMKTSRMMHGFMSAVYDTTYMREFIPSNLRKFNMTIYIHDARSFLNNTPAGRMLKRVKNNNDVNQINALTAEHTATMAICLMGCKFISYTNTFNNIILAGPTVGASQDVIDVSIEADMTSVSMTDIHDLVHGK